MSSNGRSWNEELEVIKGCAATILYRKRRNARLLPSTSQLEDLMRENQICRLKEMVKQLLPSSDTVGEQLSCTDFSSDFGQFIYNPLRSRTPRYRLNRDISCGQEVFPVRVYSDTGNCIPPEEFTYISSCDFSMFKENVISERTRDLLTVKCDCDDLICGELCSCRKMNDMLTYCTIMGDGRVFVNSNATFFNTLIVGCGSKCSCKGQCKNSLRATSLPAPFRFEVFRRSDNLGFGLRTLSNIPQGCAVVEFCGEVVKSQVLSSRGQESLDYSFCLNSWEESEIYERLASAKNIKSEAFKVLNEVAYIDPTRKGNIARFISHGCFPNLIMLRYAENDLRLHHSRAILFATQPILGGTELFFDYGINYLNRAGFKCECGTMWCDSVTARWRSASLTQEEWRNIITRKSLEYFSYVKQRMEIYDSKAKQFLRDEGIVRPEYDDLDEPFLGAQANLSRIDPACVHKRVGENEPVICYNLYCRSLSKCTCKPLVRVIPTITLD
uniref:SET domain-containing protein n=1 Tax=Haemonchus contortus TaxID=6289 RepID=A0A7I4YX96_HAECO